MDVAEAFGRELRRRRQAAHLTQEELAEKSGLHRTYISLVERGLRVPTLDAAFRLAAPLKISPSIFVRGVERALTSE